MLRDANAATNIAVTDLSRAREFYEEALGLSPEDPGAHLVTYRTGDSLLFVYRSEFAGTNRATTLTWMVDDVDAEARDLKRRGVTFEHYDLPGTTREGAVHVGGGRRVAWFRDPDGNILSIAAREADND